MASFQAFSDNSMPSNPIYWVEAFGVSSSFQDGVPGPGVTIAYGFMETGNGPSGQPARAPYGI
jgi:hypothetical protein